MDQHILNAAEALRRNRFDVSVFETASEASEYLNREIDGKVVGFGDSQTMLRTGLYDSLSAHNEVHDPLHVPEEEFHSVDTPCVRGEFRCYDCSSPDRICNALVIYWKKMLETEMEVILIDDEMGF